MKEKIWMKNDNNFFWGAATSAYQVEGGIKNDWSAAGFDAGEASDHHNRFKEDFDLAKKLGHNAHRLSIEWARVEPEEGKFDIKEIEHYKKVFASLRENGLEPFVTLWHFTNPIWFSKLGGFENKENLKYFERYSEVLSRSFPEIKYWVTINEPMIYAMNAYLRGLWPPQKRSFLGYLGAIRNLAKAHKLAYKIIHSNISSAQVGVAKNNTYFEAAGYNPWNFLLKWGADWWWNKRFLNKIRNYQDFVGFNYYFHNRIKGFKFNQNENRNVSDLGWEIYPEGLCRVLKDLRKYNKPIYITENGLADAKDEKRAQFIKEHVAWMKKAKDEGVDVRGYLHWSLIDNFEWDKGFGPRFGLIEVDYKTMERKVRRSVVVYRDIIESGIRN